MAPKRTNPLEDPRAASSSDDEEEDASSEEESDPEGGDKDELTSDEEEEDEDHEAATQKSATKKTVTVAPATKKNSNAEASESESESESDSESESKSQRAKSDVKPLAAKPMPEKSRSKVGASPAKSAVKRQATETGQDGKEAKRAKKADQVKKIDEEDGKKPGEDTKKQLFQRFFSEDDEIALLQGILEYTVNKGDPYEDMDAFCEYVKKSLNCDASKAQMVDKIRRLRRKFENSVKKGKNGEDKVFSKAHDQKAFDLWKKIWGSEGALQSAPKSSVKSKKNQGSSAKAVPAARAELFVSTEQNKREEGENKETDSNVEFALCKNDLISSRDMASILRKADAGGLDELVVMQGWDMVDETKKKEVEEKWKKLRVAQAELFMQNNEFTSEVAKLILETLKAQKAET